jgi:hypothetical protein
VVKRFIVEASGDAYVDHILKHLEDAEEKKTNLYFSSVLFAEGKLAGTKSGALDRLEADIRKLGVVIDPIPDIMKMAGRLRQHSYNEKPDRTKVAGKTRNLALGDAIYLVTGVWIRDVLGDANIIFHTFDDGLTKTNGERFTPLLSFDKWCDGIESDPDVASVIRLKRKLPQHKSLPIP